MRCRAPRAVLWLELRQRRAAWWKLLLQFGHVAVVLIIATVVLHIDIFHYRSSGSVNAVPETLAAACAADSVPQRSCKVVAVRDDGGFAEALQRAAGGAVVETAADEAAVEHATGPYLAAAAAAGDDPRSHDTSGYLKLWMELFYSVPGLPSGGSASVAAWMQRTYWEWRCPSGMGGPVAVGQLASESDVATLFAGYAVAAGMLGAMFTVVEGICSDKEERRRCVLSANGVAIGWQLFGHVVGKASVEIVALGVLGWVTLLPAGAFGDRGAQGQLWLFAAVCAGVGGASWQSAVLSAPVAKRDWRGIPGMYPMTGGIALGFAAMAANSPGVAIAAGVMAPFAAVMHSSIALFSRVPETYTPIVYTIVAAAAANPLWALVAVWAHTVAPGTYGVPRQCCCPWRVRGMWRPLRGEGPEADPADWQPSGRSPRDVVVSMLHLFKVHMPPACQFTCSRPAGLRRAAVDDLTIEAYSREVLALLGHNGAGKSTLLDVMAGISAPTWCEKAVVAGVDLLHDRVGAQSRLGVCLQKDTLWDDLTCLEHLEFFCRLRCAPSRDPGRAAAALLLELGLESEADKRASELSGGMKRRLSAACALSGEPQLLLLDEPTASLDPSARRKLLSAVAARRCAGASVILSTHFTDEAELLADRVAVMQRGRVTHYGSALALRAAAGASYRLTLRAPPGQARAVGETFPPAFRAPLAGARPSAPDAPALLRFNIADSEARGMGGWLQAAQEAGAEVAALQHTTLEDAFLMVTRRGDAEWREAERAAGGTDEDPTDEAEKYWKELRGRYGLPERARPMEQPELQRLLAEAPLSRAPLPQVRVLLSGKTAEARRSPGPVCAALAVAAVPILVAVLQARPLGLRRGPWRPARSETVVVVAPTQEERSSWVPRLVQGGRASGCALDVSEVASMRDAAGRNVRSITRGDFYGNSSGVPLGGFAVESAARAAGASIAALTNPLKLRPKLDVSVWLSHIAYVAAANATCRATQTPALANAPWTAEERYKLGRMGILCCAALVAAQLKTAVASQAETHHGTAALLRAHGLRAGAYAAAVAVWTFMHLAVGVLAPLALGMHFVLPPLSSTAGGVVLLVMALASATCSLQLAALVTALGRRVGAVLFFLCFGVLNAAQYGVPVSLDWTMRYWGFTAGHALLQSVRLCTPYGVVVAVFDEAQSAHDAALGPLPAGALRGVGGVLAASAAHCLAAALLCSAAARWGLGGGDAPAQPPSSCCTVCCGELLAMPSDELRPQDAVSDPGALAESRDAAAALEGDTCACDAVVSSAGAWSLHPPKGGPAARLCPQRRPRGHSSLPAVDLDEAALELGVRHHSTISLAAAANVQHGDSDPAASDEECAGEPRGGVRELSLVLRRRGAVALLGPNGAGKSTLVNLILGSRRAQRGRVVWVSGGERVDSHITRGSNLAYRRIGRQDQTSVLWEGLTPEDHLKVLCRLRLGAALTPAAEAAVLWRSATDLGLLPHRNKLAATLSGGTRRKLCCAAALFSGADTVFLDEPSTGLDPVSRRDFWDLLCSHHDAVGSGDRPRTTLITTHLLEEAEAVGERISGGRVGVLAAGRLRCMGSPDELRSRYGADYVLSIDADGVKAPALLDPLLRLFGHCVLTSPPQSAVLRFSVGRAPPLAAAFDWLCSPEAQELGVRRYVLAQPSTLEHVYFRFADTDGEDSPAG
eukprot:TRINITY_DN43666_c0_g1_i1.p1 TRINITY_DN43666_c0_g1~~TRINITY_DN43666_c0_g1_i1.p1  ORF type:complete len:1684 (+),score=362.42 TRINITY_DN43666_c0_g1_i1:86-5137(+)